MGSDHSKLFKKASISTYSADSKTGIMGFYALARKSSIYYTSISGVYLLAIDELTESDFRELFYDEL